MASSGTHKEACVAAAERTRDRVGGKGATLRGTVGKSSLTLRQMGKFGADKQHHSPSAFSS